MKVDGKSSKHQKDVINQLGKEDVPNPGRDVRRLEDSHVLDATHPFVFTQRLAPRVTARGLSLSREPKEEPHD